MKGFKLISLFLLFAFWQTAVSDEIVLQNGLNNYDGCEDAWVFGAYYNRNNERSKNYGSETKLAVFYGNNGSATRGST